MPRTSVRGDSRPPVVAGAEGALTAGGDTGSVETDLALAGFLQFAAAHTNHYLVPLALFGQARCLEQKKQFADARVVYEDFIARNPHSPWLGQARSALQVLEQRKRAHDRGLPPPASVPRPALVSPAAPLPIQAPPTPAAKPPAR